ncbi:MAG: DNA/RNA non-specific endonuclease [Gammaproteobacteria bacterium]|nr:DNA/RNA non-specific endonuclease [Gammaproteobacteria bacterium]
MTKNQLFRLARPLFKLLVKHPKYILVPLAIGALWLMYELFVARPNMSYMGLPKVESGIATQGWSHVLRNEAYLLEYSESLANPLWVTYKVTDQHFKSGKRPSGFKADWRSIAGIHHKSYTHSGYDRGHMAPNYIIASRYGKSAQHETFLMTNITPQKPKLNQKSWQRLEELVANDFSKWNGDFWVVTGPIFSNTPKTIKGTKVAIPKAFYKILIKPSTPERPAKALAFIFPQNANPRASLMQFVTTIDEVEKQTGIDFFSDLEDEFEESLESGKTPEAWRLGEVANRPSRY